ncbi:glutamyl-tRNA subunit a [Ilyonectria robusta]
MKSRHLLLGLWMSCLTQASLVDNGRVVTLGDIRYYVGGISIGQLGSNCTRQATLAAASIPGHDIFPMTVVETSSEEFQPTELRQTIAQYADQDDVFTLPFTRTIYLRSTTAKSPAINASALAKDLQDFGTALFMSTGGIFGDVDGFTTGSIGTDLAKGPYFVSAATGDVYKAHRLYDDDYLAFIQGVVDDENGGYMSLSAVTENVMAKSIAVPSRLYSTPSDEKPLAGLRVGVKDIYHVKGVSTSGGNRAYFYLYGTQNTTAPSIQRLIDLGAVLVGKMGTVQFANGDRPTADWVDLHAPFNPRGDGYQNPSGSSTGPGCGVGAYSWLDLAVGSDTGGSMRGPAGAVGIFGNRPSTGAISMEHVIPLSPVSDSAGIFARTGSLWALATKAWYPDFQSNYTSYPSRIYRSVARGAWSSSDDPAVLKLVESFYGELEDFLHVNATMVNHTALWSETHPQGSTSLADMLYSTYAVFVSHDQWKLLGKPFFEDYADQHDGRQPYINPGPLARWEWGQIHANDTVYDQELRNITIFKEWWETEGYGRHDPESCSEGLYVYTFMAGVPSYRDEYFEARTTPPLGFDDSSIPVMAGAPEVVVPIGEVPYESRITKKTEYLPVSMGLRMARGCDYVLADLVKDLEKAGVLRGVATGSRMYP